MRVAGKVWGHTIQIESNSAVEFHQLLILPGHKCSKHRHQVKFNGFYVQSGVLRVTVWQDDSGTVDETLLRRGDWLVVKPGLYHQFEAVETTEAFELYWTEFLDSDIDRQSFGE